MALLNPAKYLSCLKCQLPRCSIGRRHSVAFSFSKFRCRREASPSYTVVITLASVPFQEARRGVVFEPLLEYEGRACLTTLHLWSRPSAGLFVWDWVPAERVVALLACDGAGVRDECAVSGETAPDELQSPTVCAFTHVWHWARTCARGRAVHLARAAARIDLAELQLRLTVGSAPDSQEPQTARESHSDSLPLSNGQSPWTRQARQ